MKQVQVAIIGGGVSGLYAASLLENMGVDYVLLEGRAQAGGRIQSLHPMHGDAHLALNADDVKQRADLGATWVWPEFQTALAALFFISRSASFLNAAWWPCRSKHFLIWIDGSVWFCSAPPPATSCNSKLLSESVSQVIDLSIGGR